MSLFKMIVSVAFALAVASTSLAQDARALVIEGNGAFAQASALRDTDPARARELFQAAIDAWGSAMESGGFENGMLHYNIANAHLMRDEVGLAVLHYREADELMPGDRNIRANLAQARRRVPGGSPSSGRAGGAMETVLFFHSGLTERTRFGVTLVAFALTWVLATLVTLRVLPRGALWFVALACVVWIATGTSLAVDAADTTVQGVVIGGEVVGRKGPSLPGSPEAWSVPTGRPPSLRALRSLPSTSTAPYMNEARMPIQSVKSKRILAPTRPLWTNGCERLMPTIGTI